MNPDGNLLVEQIAAVIGEIGAKAEAWIKQGGSGEFHLASLNASLGGHSASAHAKSLQERVQQLSASDGAQVHWKGAIIGDGQHWVAITHSAGSIAAIDSIGPKVIGKLPARELENLLAQTERDFLKSPKRGVIFVFGASDGT